MHVTRRQLRQIIKEELSYLKEDVGVAGLGDARRTKAAHIRDIDREANTFVDMLGRMLRQPAGDWTPEEKAALLDQTRWLVRELPALIRELK
jgi:hypothetical protein